MLKAKSRLKTIIVDKLAVHYFYGSKEETIFLMPYPHASSIKPIIQSELGKIFMDLECKIISFDPPGLFQSTRKEDVSMEEMVSLTIESINLIDKNNKKLVLVGHSMSGFCCFPLIHLYPNRFKKIILIGTLAGFRDIKKHKGLPYKFGYTNRKFWQILYYGLRLMYMRGNIEIQKKLENIYEYESWKDKSKVHLKVLEKGDNQKNALVRASWPRIAKNYNFHSYLQEITQETLVLVGREDPQTPEGCSKEIHRLIPNSTLKIFEKSGHNPHVEEKKTFQKEIEDFLNINDSFSCLDMSEKENKELEDK